MPLQCLLHEDGLPHQPCAWLLVQEGTPKNHIGLTKSKSSGADRNSGSAPPPLHPNRISVQKEAVVLVDAMQQGWPILYLNKIAADRLGAPCLCPTSTCYACSISYEGAAIVSIVWSCRVETFAVRPASISGASCANHHSSALMR